MTKKGGEDKFLMRSAGGISKNDQFFSGIQ